MSLETTNSMATATVTVCEKMSQVLRMDDGPMAARSEIERYLNALLAPEGFRDYGPNGLQVEGKPEVHKIVSGVTASLALIDAAVAEGADAVLVHHGLFWRGQDGRLTGWLKTRVERLLVHGISLFAYHLPLDAHAELGNNAQFGQRLGLAADARFGEQDLGFIGDARGLASVGRLASTVRGALSREPLLLEGDGRPLERIAWCTGGAQGYFDAAIAAGADAFLTGEVSEPQAHLARETGVAFLACGHHATERFGAPAVAEHVAQRFGLAHRFIELPNPA
jgi:dinuclear metal center YbgI/SA1388 family protein